MSPCGSRLAFAVVTAAAAAVGCRAPSIQPWEYAPRPMADTLPIHEPAERGTSLIFQTIDGAVSAVGQGLNPSEIPPAWNADAFDEVANSAWFTNRNAVDPLAPEEIRRGPATTDGPDQSGPVTVTSIKSEGISPGFNIVDASGVLWILKFDPPDHPELASGAEVVATNLFWAAGYNTPENRVFHLDAANLVLEDDLEATFVEGDSIVLYAVDGADDARPLTMEVFRRNLLDRYPTRPDGAIRALGSRFLEGIPKGPFNYLGTRPDDPNDVIPHEHRRELRGMYAMAAWLNHVDVKDSNSLDMFILHPRSPEGDDVDGIGYLRHSLIDFGSALGSGAIRPHNPRHGTESDFDGSAVGLRLLTVGLYQRPWQDMPHDTGYPSIGYYQIDNYLPGDWRSNIRNPAMVNRQPRDGYWGAKLVMSFTDEQLEAAVDAGRYTDPEAEAYLLRGLKERRDATGHYWFAKVSPLDDPRVEGGDLTFDDLWVRHFGGAEEYRYEVEWDAPDPNIEVSGVVNEPRVPLPLPDRAVPAETDPDDRYAKIEVSRREPDGDWARPATFWLEWDASSRSYRVVGARY